MNTVKKLSGYILTGVGMIGFFYFKNYKGEIIPVPTVWLILSIAIGVTGAYLIVSAKMKNQIGKLSEKNAETSRIKQGGEKIVIDLNNCSFREDSVASADNVSFSRVQMIDALYDPNRNHSHNKTTVTYIIYNHNNGEEVEKFVSHPYVIDQTTLKYYVSKNMVVLYVDRWDRRQYFFEVG